jgi:predicted MFS family arabinose efflux permease
MVAGAVGMVAGGHLSDRIPNRPFLVLSELLAGACLVVAPMMEGSAFYAMLAAGALGVYAVVPMQVAQAQRLSPRTESAASGIVMGLAYANTSITLWPLGIVGDWLSRVTGSEMIGVMRLLQITSGTLFVAALCSVFIRVKPPASGVAGEKQVDP